MQDSGAQAAGPSTSTDGRQEHASIGGGTKPIPGLRGSELVKSLRGLKAEPHHFLLRLALRFGGITDLPFRNLPFLHEHVILISNPDYIQYILHNNYTNYLKNTGRWRGFRQVIGNGLLAADGENWRRQRQRVQPAFHPDRLGVLERSVTEEMDALEERWRPVEQRGEAIDAFKEMLELGLRILARTMFSRDVNSVIEPLLAAFRTVHRFIDPFSLANMFDPPRVVRRLISPGFPQFERAIRVFDDVIYSLIRDRQSSDQVPGDILSMLIRSRDDEQGELMTPRQVRDEVMVTMMAGHEPPATAITWTLYLLSMHPDAERQAYEEVRQVLGDRRCTLADVPQLRYLKMVIEESLRIYPPAWGIDRMTAKDDVIDGYRIPAGSTVAISTYVMHHHPKYWDNPEGFDPLRFSDDQEPTRPTYSYFPFGGGARRCIGFRFAMTQMPLVLATLLQRRRLELVPGQIIRPLPLLNLIPARPMMMTPRPRTAVAHVGGA